VPSADPPKRENDLNRFAVSCGNYPSLLLGADHDFVKIFWLRLCRAKKIRGENIAVL